MFKQQLTSQIQNRVRETAGKKVAICHQLPYGYHPVASRMSYPPLYMPSPCIGGEGYSMRGAHRGGSLRMIGTTAR